MYKYIILIALHLHLHACLVWLLMISVTRIVKEYYIISIQIEKMKGGVRAGLAVKAIVVVIFTSMWFRCVSAFAAAINTNHSVGGASGWDLSSNLQAWATHATFHVGDSLGTYLI